MMRVTILQYAPQERSVSENIRFILNITKDIKRSLVVLPEFGFSSYEDFEYIKSSELSALLEPILSHCKNNKLAFVTSLPINDKGRKFNRGIYISGYSTYFKDKSMLFGREIEEMTPGDTNPNFSYKKTPFIIQVCLDIIKPIQAYEAVLNGAKFILNPATVSVDYLRSINKARSLENGVPVIFCNRSGSEKSGTQYLGKSGIFFPDGTDRSIASPEGVLTLMI